MQVGDDYVWNDIRTDVRVPAYEDRFSNAQKKRFCTPVVGSGDELGAYIW